MSNWTNASESIRLCLNDIICLRAVSGPRSPANVCKLFRDFHRSSQITVVPVVAFDHMNEISFEPRMETILTSFNPLITELIK